MRPIKDAGLSNNDIDEVILEYVTRIPKIQEK